MANTKYEQIAQMETAELKEFLGETKAIYNKMRFNHAVSPVEDSTKIKAARKQIARINTELTKRQLAESK
jgi:large subunit ribosomal protein L29